MSNAQHATERMYTCPNCRRAFQYRIDPKCTTVLKTVQYYEGFPTQRLKRICPECEKSVGVVHPGTKIAQSMGCNCIDSEYYLIDKKCPIHKVISNTPYFIDVIGETGGKRYGKTVHGKNH